MNEKAVALEGKAWLALKNGHINDAVTYFHEAAKVAETKKQKDNLRRKAALVQQGGIRYDKQAERWQMK